MRRIYQVILRSLLPGMLLIAIVHSESQAAELDASLKEGWNAWRVTAGETQGIRCCYDWNMGQATRKSCDLDGRRGVTIMTGSDESNANELQIYALVESGLTRKLVALSPQCPITAANQINDFGLASGDDSMQWLRQHITGDNRLSEDALSAIAGHESGINALISTLEDRKLPMDLREQALFWLAQSDTDQAYDYLTALLTDS